MLNLRYVAATCVSLPIPGRFNLPIVQVATPPPPAGMPAAAARGTTFGGAPTSLKR